MESNKVVGTCSNCGGLVCVPTVWYGMGEPIPTCADCGAVEDRRATLPEIKTIKESGHSQRFLQD